MVTHDRTEVFASLDMAGALGPLIYRRGRSMADVARAMQLDDSIVSLWCTGKRPVPGYRLVALAGALDIPLAQLIAAGGREYKPPPPKPRASRWKPCPRACGRQCVVDAAMCLGCANGEPPLVETAPQRLASAGMTAETHKRIYESYCFLCGRGDGHDGTLHQTHWLPIWAPPPCRWCGGKVFVREVTTWNLESVVFDRDSRGDVDDAWRAA